MIVELNQIAIAQLDQFCKLQSIFRSYRANQNRRGRFIPPNIRHIHIGRTLEPAEVTCRRTFDFGILVEFEATTVEFGKTVEVTLVYSIAVGGS
jgi:hypothetical protein